MKTLLTIALTSCSILAFAQTDIIEMRSRNASLKKYERSSSLRSADHVASNFGMAPMPTIQNAVLDSVKVISDSVAIMYTSNYCSRGYQPELNLQLQYDGDQQQQKPARVYSNPRVGNLWQPGADTVVNHPLFQRNRSLDSVKRVIDASYYFNLPSDSIKFIGFDEGRGMSNENSVEPVQHKRQKNNSFGWEILLMLAIPILFLFGMSKYVIPGESN